METNVDHYGQWNLLTHRFYMNEFRYSLQIYIQKISEIFLENLCIPTIVSDISHMNRNQ